MKSFMPWLLVVAAALAVSPMVRTPSESKPVDPSKAGKMEAPKMEAVEGCKPAAGVPVPPWCEPVRVIRDFFGLPPVSDAPEQDNFHEIENIAASNGYKLRFLVALISDPIDSSSPIGFDLTLDAIQKGFGRAGYRPDRVWLPWALEAGKAEGKTEPLYRRTPGVLLFRLPSKELAVVFLIGESPKSGIQKQAFKEAMHIASSLRRPDWEPRVGILGPTFSGSVDSLLISLRDWAPDTYQGPLKFQIATGSATAADLEQRLKGFGFCRTVVPDKSLQKEAFDFLQTKMGWNRGQIALLTESDTAYGKSTEGKDLILIRFPSRITDVRNAWEQDRKVNQVAEQKAKIAIPKANGGRPALDLSLEDRDRAVDVAPNFSFLTTPAKDLELSNVLETISREGIRYVGVAATNLKDRLFLISKIRQYSPDTVVFTFTNYLLLAHPDYGEVMDGVVVISSTPLFTEGVSGLPRSSIVEDENPQRQQFSSELQQGVFEATWYLLDKPFELTPQVWISAVGNGSLWPVVHLKASLEKGVNFCKSSLPQGETTSHPPLGEENGLAGKANLQVVLFAGLLCLLSFGLRKTGMLKGRGESEGDFVLLPVDRKLFLLGAILLVVASGTLLVIGWLPEWAPFFKNSWRDPRQWPDWSLKRLLFLSSLVLIYGYLAFQLVRAMPDRREGRGIGFWALGLGTALVPILLASVFFFLWMPGGEVEFFQLRSRALGSGLSPLVSLTLMMGAIFLWTLCELKRRWLAQRQAADCPLEALCEPSVGGCKEAVDQLRPWLERVFPPERWLWMLLAAILIPPLILLWTTVQPITEAAAYGRVFLLILTLACFLALLSLLRFVAIWLSLEPILRRLNHVSPELQKAFKNLASEIEWKPMRSFAFQEPPFKMLTLSVRKLKSLVAAGRVRDQGAGALLDQIFRSEAAGLSLDERQLRRQLEDVFKQACNELGNQDPTQSSREFLALRVVAYLRYVFGHLRDSLMGAIGTGLLVLLGVTAYVFQPKQFVSLAIWMTLAAAVAMTFWILLQMDRNPALSRIAGTNPGEISFDKTFWANFTLYVVVPVLGMVATQFPEVGRLLGRMTDQILRVAGGG